MPHALAQSPSTPVPEAEKHSGWTRHCTPFCRNTTAHTVLSSAPRRAAQPAIATTAARRRERAQSQGPAWSGDGYPIGRSRCATAWERRLVSASSKRAAKGRKEGAVARPKRQRPRLVRTRSTPFGSSESVCTLSPNRARARSRGAPVWRLSRPRHSYVKGAAALRATPQQTNRTPLTFDRSPHTNKK